MVACSDSVTLIESLERDDVFKSKISSGPGFVIYGPWTIYSWSGQIGKYFMNFDGTIWKSLSKLSESHKIVEIGSTEFTID